MPVPGVMLLIAVINVSPSVRPFVGTVDGLIKVGS